MANYAVNGVPLFGASSAEARGWLRTDDPLAVVDSLREVAAWAQSTFGIGLQPRLLDFLQLLRGGRVPLPLTAQALAQALDAAPVEVMELVQAMAHAGLLHMTRRDDGTAIIESGARLADALEQFEQRLDHAFVSRHALRRALLVSQLGDTTLATSVQRLFDRFFDLGWLYLHNWAGVCSMMATLVAQAMQAEGHRTQVLMGCFHAELDGKPFRMGRGGHEVPGKLDGHVFCVVEGRVLVDFGLGNVRRHFRRDYPWALAVDCDLHGTELATLQHPRAGTVRWTIDWNPPGGEAQLETARLLAAELMQVYALPPHAGAR